MKNSKRKRGVTLTNVPNNPQRDVKSDFITTLEKRLRLPDVFKPKDRIRDLQPSADLRKFDPFKRLGLTKKLDGTRSSFKTAKTNFKDPTRGFQAFEHPRMESVCQKRRKRRESLFATGKAGGGRRIHTPKKRSPTSDVRC